jgi:hypothetical protein
MQHLDPYNDDVFKKAAEDYPLRTDGRKWENVAKGLNVSESEKKIGGSAYKNVQRKSVLICCLLLIPFAIAVTKYFNVYKPADAEVIHKQNEVAETKAIKILSAEKTGKRINTASVATIDNSAFTGIKQDFENTFQNKIKQEKSLDKPVVDEAFASKLNNFSKQNNKTKSANTNENVSTKSINKKGDVQSENKYRVFYIGAAIAPELTSVKFQPARKSFDVGLLVGYNLNKNLSIELGFMLSQKYYYTNGKYVAPNTLGQPGSKILAVNAFNSITEMPLTVQYNLRNEKKSRVFVSAGGVSYIVHKENYSYVYAKNGQRKRGQTLYNKASQNWFSNVQMSLGYERSFNKICDVRVEPYCRVPLKGIGINDLPVASMGVNLALIKIIK